jgi:hypothetical protein
MSTSFVNPSPTRLTAADFAAVVASIGIDPILLQTIAKVEAKSAGYLPDGRPNILFEAHVLGRITGHMFNASHPTVSVQRRDKRHYHGNAGEYPRLQEAMALDETTALQSAS